jgi:hypothetical protein
MALAAAATIGCANVHVQKVSVEKRMAGTDHHVCGFRYYVSRPYVVVDQAIPVAKTQWMARLVQVSVLDPQTRLPAPHGDQPRLFALEGLAPEAGDEPSYYDLSGHPLRGINRRDFAITVVKNADQPGIEGASKPPAGEQPRPRSTPGEGKGQTPKGASPPEPAQPPPLVRPPGSARRPLAGAADPTIAARAAGDALVRRVQGPGLTQTVPAPVPGLFPGPVSPVNRAAGDLLNFAAAAGAAGVRGGPAAAADHIQVIFLPDFEEQLAIRHANFAAYSKYEMHFNDGWALDGYSGNFNATQVPVAILQTIQHILGAVSDLESAMIQGRPAAKKLGGAADVAASEKAAADEVWFYLQKVMQIEPGVYRVQKSWERVAPPRGAIEPAAASGLLADLGLPVVETIQVKSASRSP